MEALYPRGPLLSKVFGKVYYPYFADGETEAWRDEITCPRPHSREDSDSRPGQVFVSKDQMAGTFPLSALMFHTKHVSFP